MKIDYQNKWAFVIGGSKGIGFSMCKEFLKRKAHVCIFARNEHTLLASVNELKDEFPSAQIRYSALDASDENALKNTFAQLEHQGITPYFLVNCAGRAIPNYFENISTSQLEATFRLNVLTVWNSIQAALPSLKKNGGYIINTSSVAGFVGVYGYSDYSMTKFGIIGLSEVLKSELEPYGIHISVLCPPDTDTPGYEEENLTKPAETIAISGNAKLMRSESVAKGALKQLEKGRFLLLVNTESRLTWILKRYFPNILYRIMQKEVRKSQNSRS